MIKCLRTAIDWGELDKITITHPLRCDPENSINLNEEEVKRPIEAASGPYRTGIIIALHTEMRLRELMALN